MVVTMMFRAKFTFLALLWLSLLNLNYTESRKISKDALPSPTGCMNCTICQYPCHHLVPPPPPSSEYPLYGAPPPPSPFTEYTPPPPSPLSGYPSYGAPPSQANCTPVQCCNYPPPYPYTYQPEESHSASYPPFIFILAMVVLFSITVLL